ncbi:hypothetical protein EJ02DRAFT_484486 [Clathrospora elynae]|uniref:Rhodopsin domain-containing protein n=1 Tax=Clathrospora elynae TaxID=706981 RepID=A0A6A5SVH2_9PLEO|nr:hypothetical protein EJ02DRAFT_484486 [Clathrospora elynae]
MVLSTGLAIQSLILYAIAISFIFTRIMFRRIMLGSFKKIQTDDWLMIIVLIPFTAAIALANQNLALQSAKERKFRFLLEEVQIITTWLVDACLLILYWRIIPQETNGWKQKSLIGISAFCCISFFVVQASLLAWCPPTEAHWNLTPPNSQCITYHGHTAITLAINILNTILIMMVPVPFIPTPRRLLLTILLIIGTLVLFTGTIGRSLVLTNPLAPAYLHWYTTEPSLSIIFANLPFLTFLVFATAPARLRLSQWPRNRHSSWASSIPPPLSRARIGSTATTMSSMSSTMDVGKAAADRRVSDQTTIASISEPVPGRASIVAKTRLSGGLAEMGRVSVEDRTQGGPTYWQ